MIKSVVPKNQKEGSPQIVNVLSKKSGAKNGDRLTPVLPSGLLELSCNKIIDLS